MSVDCAHQVYRVYREQRQQGNDDGQSARLHGSVDLLMTHY